MKNVEYCEFTSKERLPKTEFNKLVIYYISKTSILCHFSLRLNKKAFVACYPSWSKVNVRERNQLRSRAAYCCHILPRIVHSCKLRLLKVYLVGPYVVLRKDTSSACD